MTTFVDNQTVITASWLNKVENTVPSEGNIVLAKASGNGIKVDTASPTYPWADLIGSLTVKETGATAPTLSEFTTGVRALSFAAGDKADLVFHIPHDYVPGTDLYIHTHWTHRGTAISGTLGIDYNYTYAKGFAHASGFHAPKQLDHDISITSAVTHPAYIHQISEIQLTSNGGDATHLDRNMVETDGVLILTMTTTTIPTITGGTVNEPFIFSVDIHYQSTGVGTKNKSPNFWS